MISKRITAAFAGITAGLIAIFTATTPTAGATNRPTVATVKDPHAICRTGFRGNPAYDMACLKTGHVGDAAALWFGIPEGRRGHEADDDMTRRGICRFAYRHGGVRAAAVELVTDLTYDNYRNNGQVNRWVANMAQGDCLRLGYADPVSGMVPVNLRALPKGECWFEVSYLDHKRTAVNVEPLCKG